MRAALLCLLFAVVGCASTGPAGVRRRATSRLLSCVRTVGKHQVSPWDKVACLRASERYCLSKGLEKSCGVDGVW